MRPEQIRHFFYLGQILLGAAFLGVGWLFIRPKESESGFKLREADRKPVPGEPTKTVIAPDALANARIQKAVPLSLPGIRIVGSPHEVLGISPGASKDQVQRAYRELMKRYHPDKIGRPGSREWKDAQKIAEALNLAKEKMLK